VLKYELILEHQSMRNRLVVTAQCLPCLDDELVVNGKRATVRRVEHMIDHQIGSMAAKANVVVTAW
jgi:hypothetical protein